MSNNYLIETQQPEAMLGGLGIAAAIAVVLVAIIFLVLLVLIIISNCKMFKKAGEDWWKALVPLYNSWIETKICGLKWYWFLIYAVLLAIISRGENEPNYIAAWGLLLTSFNYNFNLAKKYGKSNGFAVFNTILPFIGLPILAFGSAQYDKSVKVDDNGIFSTKKW